MVYVLVEDMMTMVVVDVLRYRSSATSHGVLLHGALHTTALPLARSAIGEVCSQTTTAYRPMLGLCLQCVCAPARPLPLRVYTEAMT